MPTWSATRGRWSPRCAPSKRWTAASGRSTKSCGKKAAPGSSPPTTATPKTMIDPVSKQPHTYHTTNPVPFILVNDDGWKLRSGGALKDIAPTLLGVLGEKQPAEMKGRDLRQG